MCIILYRKYRLLLKKRKILHVCSRYRTQLQVCTIKYRIHGRCKLLLKRKNHPQNIVSSVHNLNCVLHDTEYMKILDPYVEEGLSTQ